MKYAFDHEQEALPEGLGMTDERATEIIKHVRRTEIDSNDTLEHFENAINAVDPENMVEAIFAGYVLGRLVARNQSEQSALSKLFG